MKATNIVMRSVVKESHTQQRKNIKTKQKGGFISHKSLVDHHYTLMSRQPHKILFFVNIITLNYVGISNQIELSIPETWFPLQNFFLLSK